MNAPAAAHAITHSSDSCPRAAWMPQTITAVSLGNAGMSASPAQIPSSNGYVQSHPVSRSIRPWSKPSSTTYRSSGWMARSAARPCSGAVDLALEAAPEQTLEPDRGLDERIEIHAGFDPVAFQQVDEILGREVPRRARRGRTAAETA